MAEKSPNISGLSDLKDAKRLAHANGNTQNANIFATMNILTLARILAANSEFLKINNIEKAMGLTPTTLVRMIARGNTSVRNYEQIENWWNAWVASLMEETEENVMPTKTNWLNEFKEYQKKIPPVKQAATAVGKSVTVHLTEENFNIPEPKSFTKYIVQKKDLMFEQEFIDFYKEVDNDPNLSIKQKTAIRLA